MKKKDNKKKRPALKFFLPFLMLVCVIVLCFSVGKTYAVITEATNVVVNTFYGESEIEETEPETETEQGTETETESEAETETETESEPETETETETEETVTSETETSEADTGEGALTGDSTNILIWIIIALAALIVLLFCLRKLIRLRKE